MDALNDFRAAALALAGRHVDTVMPGYTHTQHAQPISLGYYLLPVADLTARDLARLEGALGRCDRSPLGSRALAATGLPLRSAECRVGTACASPVDSRVSRIITSKK